jgi:N-formylglutamate deformylase
MRGGATARRRSRQDWRSWPPWPVRSVVVRTHQCEHAPSVQLPDRQYHYARTCGDELLRRPNEATERQLIERFFEPYAQGVAELVAERLTDIGRVVIIDVHSYPRSPMAYEVRAGQPRPQLCLGVDAFHSPASLVEAACRAFDGRLGKVGVNQPFAGAYIPLRWFGKDRRVGAIMLEVRRDTYMDEATGAPISLGQVTAGYVRLIDSVA